MGCEYRFTNNPDTTPLSYADLVKDILEKINAGKIIADDIVYSRASGEILLNQYTEKLKELNLAKLQINENVSFVDGEPKISANDAISSLELIDSAEFKLRTGANIALINEENFIKNLASIYESDHSPEEALLLAKNIVNHWHQILNTAKELHMIISDFNFGKSQADFEDRTKDTEFKDVSDELYASMNKVLHDIYKNVKINNLKSNTLNNINVRVGLDGINLDLLLHIDKAVIDGNGNIHVYTFKTTTTSSNQWDTEKWKKYKILMALIKRSLESLGFDSSKIYLNIVPIEVKYSDDLSNIKNVEVKSPIQLNIYNKPSGGVSYSISKEYSWVKKLIKSSANFDNITLEDRQPVNDQLDFLFLNKNLKLEGVQLTAESWIKRNIRDGGKIRRLQDPDYDFIVYFDENDVVKIPKGNSTDPLKNEILIKEVKERTSLLDKNEGGLMEKIIQNIQKNYDNGTIEFRGRSGIFLKKVFQKYLRRTVENKGKENEKVKYEWEFLENDILSSANILVFRNTNTYQLDFVVLSPYDLKSKMKLKKSNLHILGDHLYTGSSIGSLLEYKPTFGNLEAVRASLIINQILPKLTGEYKLGKLHIVSLENRGQGNIHELETLNKDLITPIIGFMNLNPNMSVNNNFTGLKFINAFDILLQEYKELLDDIEFTEEDGQIFINDFDQLASASTLERKRTLLLDLASRFPKVFPEFKDTKELLSLSKTDTNVGNAAKLYIRVLQSLTYYETPGVSSILEKLSKIPEYVSISERLPNKNFQIIQHVYTKAIDNVAANVLKEVEVTRQYFFEYYDKCGYSRLQNSTFGGLASTFKNLFQLDDNGNRTLTLKNPYNMSEDLEDYEREFLKKVLFSFNKIRSLMKGDGINGEPKFNFTLNDINSDRLKKYAESTENYFDIPLERASKSTRIQQPVKERMTYTLNKIKDVVRNGKNAFDVFGLDLSDEEIEAREESISSWELRNKFERGEVNRADVIASHDMSYFETNLDRLLIDFIEKYHEHIELNKALIISKAVSFELEVLKGITNDEDVIKQTEDLIEKFNKVNIFNSSIMDEKEQQFFGGFITPVKKLVSTTLIAGNVISAFRDTFEGAWQNIARTLNHYQTGINFAEVMQGYKTVVENSFTDARSINIVNLLCLKYRLSNIDISKISEGAKTEGGIVNYTDWLYATIKKPDFLNRMVLFVAQCYKDGVYDAFSIDENGALKYDWKKDKRFSIYASGDKSNPEYAKLMGAYYNAVRDYNKDHPEASISYNGEEDPLPEPYSDTEIKQFKLLANSIYGAYDKSTKALYEYMTIGATFGMFSTWMNGMYANYFAKPGQYYSSEFNLEQETDSSGNLLFFDDDGNLIYKKEDKYYYDGTDILVTLKLTNIQPVMKKVPIIVQGIFYSLHDAYKAATNGEFKSWLASSPQDRANLRKFISDLLFWALFAALFGLIFNPAYKDYKKDMKNNPLIQNVIVELLYKSSSRSFDGFRGAYNLIEYVGENANTPLYSQPIKLVKESFAFLIGKKTFGDVITRNVAVFKVFQDSYKAEKKK